MLLISVADVCRQVEEDGVMRELILIRRHTLAGGGVGIREGQDSSNGMEYVEVTIERRTGRGRGRGRKERAKPRPVIVGPIACRPFLAKYHCTFPLLEALSCPTSSVVKRKAT